MIALASHNPSGIYWMRRRYTSSKTFSGETDVARVYSHRNFERGEVFNPLVCDLREDIHDPNIRSWFRDIKIFADLKRGTIERVLPGQTEPKLSYPVLVMAETLDLDEVAKQHDVHPQYIFNKFIPIFNIIKLEITRNITL